MRYEIHSVLMFTLAGNLLYGHGARRCVELNEQKTIGLGAATEKKRRIEL